ncbi:MAG: RluA family pseudouridine synthase [Candidatus Omnitrophica bacterium]|nr:RluA family pseudouridine synthase [Candidatus Omnitrophota bacterium]
MKYSFTVHNGEEGIRLDLYLVSRLPKDLSRTRIQKLIKRKKVLVNGTARKANYKLDNGDFIEVETRNGEEINIGAERIDLDIIYEDDKIIIVNKPAGMVVHPAPGNFSGTLVNALLYHTKNLSRIGEDRPGVIHRLDKDTSGLIVIAKDEPTHAALSRQFSRRTTEKSYIAVVEGVVQLDNGVISYPIGRHARDRKKMAVKFSDSKECITRYHVIERFGNNTLLDVKPETGRTHQIRVHLAYIGHPVTGDMTYGKNKKSILIRRQALHAHSITFVHPGSKKRVSFSAPLPDDMKDLIEKLKNRV